MSLDIEKGVSNIQLTSPSTKGFCLPSGYCWNPQTVNGKKEGSVEVYTNDGMIYAQLCFHEDKLEGECVFFEEGIIHEKRFYKNDVMNGWCILYENGIEVTSFLYDNGVKVKKVERQGDMWKLIDIKNESNYEVCNLDKNHLRQGLCYKFMNNELMEECLFQNDELIMKCKEFKGGEMVEYNKEGMKVYQGEFCHDLRKGYCRDGKGKELEKAKVTYVGDWKNGKRHGEG